MSEIRITTQSGGTTAVVTQRDGKSVLIVDAPVDSVVVDGKVVYNLRLWRAINEAHTVLSWIMKLSQMTSDALMTQDLGELGLWVRAEDPLRRADINTIGELCEKTERDLMGLINFGPVALDDVLKKLAEHQLKLKPG